MASPLRAIASNPLIYPAGYLPGINNSHPATSGLTCSAVASGSTFTELINGARWSTSGSPTSVLNGRMGPAVNFPGAQNATIAGKPGTVPTAFTSAALVYLNATPLGNTTLLQTGTTSGANKSGLQINTTPVFGLSTNSVAINSTIPALSGVPYFVAATGVSGSPVYFVVTNLLTGTVQTNTASNFTPSTLTGSGTYVIAQQLPNAVFLNGGVCAAMYSLNAITPDQLLAWGSEPFSFWYPRRSARIVGTAAIAAFNAAWALNRNKITDGVAT